MRRDIEMTAGLPSAGIGGLFYLASAILLPFRSGWRRLRGVPDKVTVRMQIESLGIALGMLGGMWLAGWLLALVMPVTMLPHEVVGTGGLAERQSLVRASFFAIAVLTLLVVLSTVEVARLMLRVRSPRRRAVGNGGVR
jgi:hypothetical protein